MALGGAATTVLTADDLVTSISTLTAKSQALLEPAETLSLVNAAGLLIGAGPWAVSIAFTLLLNILLFFSQYVLN